MSGQIERRHATVAYLQEDAEATKALVAQMEKSGLPSGMIDQKRHVWWCAPSWAATRR